MKSKFKKNGYNYLSNMINIVRQFIKATREFYILFAKLEIGSGNMRIRSGNE